MKPLRICTDENGRQAHGAVPQSDTINAYVVAANSPVVAAVPAGATFCLFYATGDFWARIGGAAAIPTGAITDGSAPEANPTLRELQGATTIGLVAPNVCTITLAFYS